MALVTCPECSHNVSDKAISCPNCGYPMNPTPTEEKLLRAATTKPRRKRKKLPNGFGSIKKLSGKRTNPYAAYPPTTEFHFNGSPVTVPAIGYYKDWYAAFDALREYNHNPYDIKSRQITFKEVYELWFKEYAEDRLKPVSDSAKYSYITAFKNCPVLHNMPFIEVKDTQMQAVIDNCELGHSSLTNFKKLFSQVYKFALKKDIVNKNYAQFVTIKQEDDVEKGEPFSPEELSLLWANKENKTVQMILIMIYSGFRISAFETIEINLESHYFKGGVKTSAGIGRIVPIHDAIYGFTEMFFDNYPAFNSDSFRKRSFYPVLEKLGIVTTVNGKKHTPHDCRHTFSWLCDKYGVNDTSKHILMGHSLGNDVEKSVYTHRTFDELKSEINKIIVSS